MSDSAASPTDRPTGTPADAPTEDFDVVLLIEQRLSEADAREVRSLHEGLDVAVTYHVLLPVEDAAAQVQATLGAVSESDLVPGPPMLSSDDISELTHEARTKADADVAASIAALEGAGAQADGKVVSGDPIEALKATVEEVDGREVIVLTEPHVIAGFFHVDWASSARRHLGVPVLHLIERENFDEQAGGGEGVTGL